MQSLGGSMLAGADGVVVAARIDNCIVVTAPADLGRGHLEELERATLKCLHAGEHTRGVVFELGGVQYMDSREFEGLKAIARMMEHLGIKPMFVGLRPGIIAHLAQADVDLSGVPAALGLDEALAILTR